MSLVSFRMTWLRRPMNSSYDALTRRPKNWEVAGRVPESNPGGTILPRLVWRLLDATRDFRCPFREIIEISGFPARERDANTPVPWARPSLGNRFVL
jgi:hypothetical protein